ncbi:bacteriophage pi2 protein 35 [Streptococcus pseudoporcinus]|uniref:Bacteriophage pi2 protein 35 n=1 Tax=Streptococcus pseudoporcinus TaxID=361101 RepID=A0A4U9XMY0_9STRE|nr:bacteriophage pi2 protein 35 [Streptococcus pseudoporcinus]
MNKTQLLSLLKLKLGISTNLRDDPLNKIIDSVISEVEKVYGITLDTTRSDHETFLIDFAAYRYEGGNDMPRSIQWRLHNLQISNRAVINIVE